MLTRGSRHVYTSGECEIDLDRRELRLLGTPAPISSRAFDILELLVCSAGALVSKDELMERVWPGTFVTDNALQVHISALRKALGACRTMLRTESGRGYRLLGEWVLRDQLSASPRVSDTPPIAEPEEPATNFPGFTTPLVGARVNRVYQDSQPVASALPLPDKPSIAILPFQNMSGDPEQEYFADGMVEEIITALSRNRWLFVIARNSSFTYKGQAVDVKRVGRDLGVRYVLEGSVRKGGNRLRIIGQLVDAENGAHLWADRFEGILDDVFDLQDRVTASVVGAIAPKLEQAEMARARRRPTESLDAYDNYLRGLAGLHAVFEGDREAVSESLRRFSRAIELDPEFAAAFGMAAWCYVLRKNYGWAGEDAGEAAEMERLARQAARLATRVAREDTIALYAGGFALTRLSGELDAGTALIDRALALDPNLAAAWHLSGWVRILRAEPDIAIAHMAQAMRLNPLDPLIFGMQSGTALAHFLAGRYDDAAAWAEKAYHRHARYAPAARVAAASHALAGRLDEARHYMNIMRQVDPDLRLANLSDFSPYRKPEDAARYAQGLRLAGLPD